MTEQTEPAFLPVSDPYKSQPTFVNQLVASGYVNGVVNLTLATALFTPLGGKVEPDLAITARLRMDMFCVHQLYERLGAIIQENVNQSGEKPN